MRKRNVVVVVLDTARKDTFDDYAPRILDRADANFERCYAPSSWSVPSHAAMLTGRLPHEHGVHSYNPDYADLDGTFLEDLDHRSIGVSANGAVSASFNFDQHFDEFVGFAGNDEYTPEALSFKQIEGETGIRRYGTYLREAARRGAFRESLLNGLYRKANDFFEGRMVPTIGDGGARRATESALEMATDAEPFVLFINLIDAHGPMQNHRGLESDVPYRWTSRSLDGDTVRERNREAIAQYLENYRDLYAANVRYLDRRVTEFIDALDAATQRDTAHVLTADHGEELRFERERDLGHMDFSTSLLHVPFTVIGAKAPDVGTDRPTSLLDLGTVVHALADGRDVPDVQRERVPAERIGMSFYDGDDPYWVRGARAVYEDDAGYRWDTEGRSQLVSTASSSTADRSGVDVPGPIRDEFSVGLEEYVTIAKRDSSAPRVTNETREQLENLGYSM